MQALTHLDTYSQRGFEAVFGGDLNWIEEERGPMKLLPGWCDAVTRSVLRCCPAAPVPAACYTLRGRAARLSRQ